MSSQTAGLICAHHHLYSTLARGMPAPKTTPNTFLEILQQIWWRLDIALDNEMIYWSAMLGATEALLSGTTCIIDHHESPNCIEGSLSTIAKACSDVGVRVNACYGVTDRWDNSGNLHSKVSPLSSMTSSALRGLDECDRYLRQGGRGMVGVHAAFTCSDETLHVASDLAKKHSVGVHLHVAEGLDDEHAGARLESLATENWLLVHAVHLDRHLPGYIVHNPRSNMNNSVGYARPSELKNKVLLGTDGIGADMLEEARLAYARLREYDVTQSPVTVWSWLENSYEIFPEARHDKVTYNYDHVDSEWHAAFTPSIRAIDVEVDGEKIVVNGSPTRVDIYEIRAKAAEQTKRLHERLATL
ncbi:MAG: amidohydrolase family protein [Acidimicrobiaceae bacterium]|nr:amidohydrolase family protein [Acidimicrobiaceae bacterium]